MRRFLILLHDDTTRAEDPTAWEPYLARLRRSGRFDGGSSVGPRRAYRQGDGPPSAPGGLVGYLLVRATDAEEATWVLDGNPVHAAGGTVEILELVED